ncbi:hypothetical protein GCM10009740_15390 [Terrabacter terrae]|uniref:Uncharacterized protein n=1 Tax=Terrabacter terrae TaxID=318434 RepID=A0ABP5FGY2_9MICO
MTDVCTDSGHDPLPGRTTVTAQGGGVSFDVPVAWDAIELAPGEVVAAVEPDDADRFRTNVVVTFTPVDGALVDWDREASLREAAELDGYLLLDREDVEVGGHPGTRRLTTHATPAGESVTTECWSTVVDGIGITLIARVATLRVPEMAPVIEAVAASLVVRTERLVAA